MQLDFFVVGAQKAGTTTVHEFLSSHPNIYLPIEKETRFFSGQSDKSVSWYLDKYFRNAPASQLKGEVCPDYMMFSESPRLIKQSFPESKIIFCLRNPVDRAYSHYKMSYLRGRETRGFGDAIRELVNKPADSPVERSFDYLKFGEYGRIIDDFLEYFEAGSIFVMFFDDLIVNPENEVKKIIEWLGEDSKLLSSPKKQAFNQSKEIRFTILHSLINFLQDSKQIKHALSMIIDRGKLRKAAKWIKFELNTKEPNLPSLTPEARAELVEYYRADIKQLELKIGAQVPWVEYK